MIVMRRRSFLQTVSGLFAIQLGPNIPGFAQTEKAKTWRPPVPLNAVNEMTGPSRGPWRRLFLDPMVMEESHRLKKVFFAAEKYSDEPIIPREKPWETGKGLVGPYLYGSVIHQGNRFKMWYQCLKSGVHICYAESKDGIHWEKPELGVLPFNGSQKTNIVISTQHPEITNGACSAPNVFFLPHEPNPSKRFMLIGYADGYAHQAFSQDGIHWTFQEGELFATSDVLNVNYDVYHERYLATWKTGSRRGRSVGVAYSKPDGSWEKILPGPVFVPDGLDPDATQFYGMPVFAYQGLYIGLPWAYHARYFKQGPYSAEKMLEAQTDSPRTVDVQLAWSWDLINWTRTPDRKPFLSRGTDGLFDDGMIYTARSPIVVDDRLYFYYGGFDGPHDENGVKGNIGLATLRVDGFCAMQAEEEGWLISRRERLSSPEIVINAKTSANGYITAEILDRHNQVLAGFSKGECQRFQGDCTHHKLTWKAQEFSEEQREGDKKIRFYSKDAQLFSYLSI